MSYLRKTRICIAIIIAGLAVSGITAFPLETELSWLNSHNAALPIVMQHWLTEIYTALKTTNHQYPYLSYGTDWLAFAHIMLAVLFIGPYKDPVKNSWVIQFGLVACVAIIPLAFSAGPIRQIPLFWTLIDCSFGAFGAMPLLLVLRYVKRMQTGKHAV